MTHLRARRFLVAALLVALAGAVTAGCSEDRPAPETWRTTWDGLRGRLPMLEDLTAGSGQELCSAALAMLRAESPSLSPTPDLAIDDVVTDWIRLAEDTFFECPPRGEEIDSFEKAYAELERLEAEVAIVLELDTAP